MGLLIIAMGIIANKDHIDTMVLAFGTFIHSFCIAIVSSASKQITIMFIISSKLLIVAPFGLF